MTTRTHTQQTKKPIPASPQEWNRLLSQTIRRAEALQSPRLAGLRKAMLDGKAEKHLREMGILSEVDVDREFPVDAK